MALLCPLPLNVVHQPVAVRITWKLGGNAESQVPHEAGLLTKHLHCNKILRRSARTLQIENHLLSILAGRGLGQRLIVKAYS